MCIPVNDDSPCLKERVRKQGKLRNGGKHTHNLKKKKPSCSNAATWFSTLLHFHNAWQLTFYLPLKKKRREKKSSPTGTATPWDTHSWEARSAMSVCLSSLCLHLHPQEQAFWAQHRRLWLKSIPPQNHCSHFLPRWKWPSVKLKKAWMLRWCPLTLSWSFGPSRSRPSEGLHPTLLSPQGWASPPWRSSWQPEHMECGAIYQLFINWFWSTLISHELSLTSSSSVEWPPSSDWRCHC